jgi:hypothetical protein
MNVKDLLVLQINLFTDSPYASVNESRIFFNS